MTKENIIGTKKERAKRINGSEFATVLEGNPYKKRIELVLEKAGVIADTFEGNEATKRGEALENNIIAMFEDETGLSVWGEQNAYSAQCENCLELCCHVDGLVGEDAIFEAKTTDIKGNVWKNGIPEYYKRQLDFNCMLADKNKAYIAVGYCKENEIVKFEYFEYTPEMCKEDIVTKCQVFTADVNEYRKLGVINTGVISKVDIDSKLIEELEDLKEKISDIKKCLKPYEDRVKIIETRLKEQIGDAWGIENDLYKITMGNRITAPTYTYKICRSGLKIEYK